MALKPRSGSGFPSSTSSGQGTRKAAHLCVFRCFWAAAHFRGGAPPLPITSDSALPALLFTSVLFPRGCVPMETHSSELRPKTRLRWRCLSFPLLRRRFTQTTGMVLRVTSGPNGCAAVDGLWSGRGKFSGSFPRFLRLSTHRLTDDRP